MTSTELISSVLDALPDPALVLEGADRVVAVNEQARVLFASEGNGRLDRLEHVTPRARAVVDEPHGFASRGTAGQEASRREDDDLVSWKVWSAAQPEPQIVQFEGDARFFRPTVSAFPGEGRRLVVLRDVSDSVEAGRRIHAVREEFLSAAAHKFTTPLTAITMHVHLLKTHERQRDPDSPLLTKLAQLDHHLARLGLEVNEVMDLAQLRAGELNLQLLPVDFVALVKRVVEDFGSRRSEREMRFEADAAFQLARVDAARIEQVVRQLVDNADRYSDRGQPVTVRVSGDSDSVVLEVLDHGVGIPPEDQPRLFEPYFRSDNVKDLRLGTGLGMGLFLSRALVHLHGGQINIQSELEKGTHVTVRIPRPKAR